MLSFSTQSMDYTAKTSSGERNYIEKNYIENLHCNVIYDIGNVINEKCP